MMRVAFDVADTLIEGVNVDRPRKHVLNLYRSFRAIPNCEVVLWSSDISLAREVMRIYQLEPDRIHDKSQHIGQIVDLAFDDKPEYVKHKAKQVITI